VSSRREVLLWNIESNSEHPAASELANRRWSGEDGQLPPDIVVISETREEVGHFGGRIRAFADSEHLCAIDSATGEIVGRKTEETYPPPSISVGRPSGSDKGFDYIAHAEPERIAEIAIAMSGGGR
jgi:hypothetical protein